MAVLIAWEVDRGLSEITCLAFNPTLDIEYVVTGDAPLDTHVQLATYPVVPQFPVSTTPYQKQGSMIGAWFDDLYNRIHIAPRNIALGNTFGNQTRTVNVWNAHLTPKVLDTIDGTGTDGMSITTPSALPITFSVLAEKQFTLNVSLDGPAIINGTFLFSFTAEAVSLGVTGRRVVTWPYPPNWKTPVTEMIEWKTDILRSFDGSEVRRELRTRPRRSFTYNLTLHGREPSRLDNLLWGWQNRSFAVPVWMDKSKLISDINAGALSINLSTVNKSFAEGGLAIVYADSRRFEIVEINTLTASVLTLKRPIESSWSAGISVYPCVIAHLPKQVSVNRLTDSAISVTVDFACEPAATDPYLPVAAAPMTHQGVEVVSRQPNWQGGIDNTFDYVFSTLDTDSGTILWYDSEAFPRINRNYNWLLKDRDAIRKMREMLARRRGRMKAAFVPTWHSDMTLIEDVGALAVSFKVEANEFAEMVGAAPSRQHLVVRLKSGQWLIRQVLSANTVGIETTIVLDSAVGVSFTPSDVQAIHMVMLSRLNTDSISFQWHTDSVVVVNTPFINIKG